jgi:hypothetical protein
MENRSNGSGKKLATTREKFHPVGPPTGSIGNQTESALIAPTLEVGFEDGVDHFQPGDFLRCEYTVNVLPEHEIQAIETSVIWMTEGKGDTDIGVHHFERRQKQALTPDTFKHPQRISTVMPASPLTYEGNILKIRWCIRVRLFLPDANQVTHDCFFSLGETKTFSEITELIDSAQTVIDD